MVVVTPGQQYNAGEKPTVIMYNYINRHAGPPNKKQKDKKGGINSNNNTVYDNSAIESYNSKMSGRNTPSYCVQVH